MNDLVRQPGNESPGEGHDPVSFRTLAATSPWPPTYSGPDWYSLAQEVLERLAASARQGNPFQQEGLARTVIMEDFTTIATGFVDSFQQGDHFLVTVLSGQKGSPIVNNMVNVSILATKLGMGLGYQREDLIQLALAGLLHDVGMFTLPESLVSSPGPLSQEDRARLQQHPERGFQMLSKLGSQYSSLAQVAWQEHERWNGQGYPRGLKEQQIDEYARIIGIVDVFDALISARPYRRRLLPNEAVRELLTAEKASFPSQVIKALLQQFSLFPLGTVVRLNTGEIGAVAQLNQQYPLRPVVAVTQGLADGQAGAIKFVDLSATTLVHIVEVVRSDTAE